jgi:hypothetical protein
MAQLGSTLLCPSSSMLIFSKQFYSSSSLSDNITDLFLLPIASLENEKHIKLNKKYIFFWKKSSEDTKFPNMKYKLSSMKTYTEKLLYSHNTSALAPKSKPTPCFDQHKHLQHLTKKRTPTPDEFSKLRKYNSSNITTTKITLLIYIH